jgi:hypothetical protein
VFSAPARAWWAATAIAAAIVELCLSSAAPLTRPVVGMLGLIAVVVGVIVLCGAGDEPAPILDPVPEPVPEPEPPPPLNEVIR